MADIITTVTKDINEITKIKNDLNALLRENGIEGGPVFSTYPDKFRSLFRVLDGRTEESTWNLPVDSVSVITSVPKPVIVRRENSNTFYLYCANPDASIYYTIDSEHYHIGERLYTAHGLLTITEDSYITAYAKIREVKSDISWWNVEHLAEDTPESPEFDRDGTTLTITCSTEDAIIWYRIGEVGEFSQYTEVLTNVPRTSNVYAYSSNLSHQSSEIVVDEAPEKIEKPHTPEVSQDINEIIVTSDEDDVDLYWKKTTDTDWTPYNEGDTISESGYYISMAIRDGVMSEWSTPVELRYYIKPNTPTINLEKNVVSLECTTPAAAIYYQYYEEDEWILYEGAFELEDTITIRTKSVLDEVSSDISSWIELEHTDIPAKPVITNTNNIINMTTSTEDATIYYRIKPSETWIPFTTSFEITHEVVIEAKAVKNGMESVIETVTCFYVYIERPATPRIVCSANEVYIYAPVSGSTIYYRVYGSSVWNTYSGSFTINQTDYYESYCSKDGFDSYVTWPPVLCEYIEEPEEVLDPPTIVFFNNVYEIFPSTNATMILTAFSGDTSWTIHDVEGWNFSIVELIHEDVTIFAKCANDTSISETVYKFCKYVNPNPSEPVISCIDNIVTITTIEEGFDIYYREYHQGENNEPWIKYNGPFSISETIILEAKIIYSDPEMSNFSRTSFPFTCVYYGVNDDSSFDYNYYYNLPFTIKIVDVDKPVNAQQVVDTRILITAYPTHWIGSAGMPSDISSLNFEYKINDGRWIPVNFDWDNYPNLNAWWWSNNNGTAYSFSIGNNNNSINKKFIPGDIVQFRANMNPDLAKVCFGFSHVKAIAYGNILSLSSNYLYDDNEPLPAKLFSGLFYYADNDINDLDKNYYLNLISAKNLILPSKILGNYCYSGMFLGNAGLKEGPRELPATEIGDYAYLNMFSNCTSLLRSPEIKALTVGEKACSNMFEICRNLVYGPSILPAKNLGKNCYEYMFSSCYNLIYAPELPATNLSICCYKYMFSGCTLLETAPNLPATILAIGCYCSMFSNCPALKNIPVLQAPNLVEKCYYGMFVGINQANITCLAKTNIDEGITEYLENSKSVSFIYNYDIDRSLGTFTKKRGVEWPKGAIPKDWTIIEV